MLYDGCWLVGTIIRPLEIQLHSLTAGFATIINVDYNQKIQLNTDLFKHISGRIGKNKLSNLFVIDRQLTITCNDKISKMVTVIMMNACFYHV